MKVYYAHHIWKYGTPIEDYELDCIKKRFEDAEIINPRTNLPQELSESEILDAAYGMIKDCDALVFSTVSGMIGHGVFNEITIAVNSGVAIYQLEGDSCYNMNIRRIRSDREWG